MFTGIIETTGKVTKLTDKQLVVEASGIISELKKGSSIAVDGACLTVVELSDNTFTIDFMPETEAKSILESYQNGQVVNLELPLKADGRFDGHMVTGHVEGVGELTSIANDGNAILIRLEISSVLNKYIIPKGSIALNGISLTVIDVTDNDFSVSIIPHTWEVTNLHTLKEGDKVNVETDVLAKYIEKFARLKN